MAAFIYKGSRDSNSGQMIVEGILADSTEFSVGEAVKWHTDGTLVLWAAGGAGLGIIVGLRKAKKTLKT